jgi:ABC-type polysaccharide/polyol phosphate transport system ATPase subunit
MSSDITIEFNDVWKKYSMNQAFHNSFREEIVNVFKPSRNHKHELHSGEFWALQGVNISVRRGECIGLYGPNGSGKSTILKLMANVTFPTKGALTVKGKVAPLIELGAGFHNDLTGRENVYMNGTILGMSINDIRQKMDDIIEFSGMRDFIDVPVKKYSSGMYLRLAFSIAIHSKAEIYLFDEILTVGDEMFQKKCADKIHELRSTEVTILIVSHDHKALSELTDRIVYLKKGTIHNEQYDSN